MLLHDFVYLPHSFEPSRYSELTTSGGDVRIGVDEVIVEYLADTLKWVPSFNPAFRDLIPGCGLNLYGVTGIGTSGATVLAPLCRAWSAVFAVGPPVLELHSGWDLDTMEQHIASTQRDEAVSALSELAEMAETVVQGGSGWILHLGI